MNMNAAGIQLTPQQEQEWAVKVQRIQVSFVLGAGVSGGGGGVGSVRSWKGGKERV